MININDKNVKEVVKEAHEAILRKIKKGSQVKEDIIIENRIFSILCSDFDIEPRQVANRMREKYGYDMTSSEVIQVFRKRRMANPVERKELLQWAQQVVDYFSEAIEGKIKAIENFEKLRKEPALSSGKRHESQERMVVIMIYEKHPEIDSFDDVDSVHFLGNTLAKYFFYDISDAILDVYGFANDNKKSKKNKDVKNKLTYEQAIKRVEYLENTLDRTNTMLQDLQEEFAEQLEESKSKELADFFAKLNSEKYGCILDELLVVRKGVDELRKSNYELPIEINGLLIMVKKLIQFVRDSHIEPMMRTNSIKDVTATDVEFCNYEGTPFTTPEEKKKVKVISPGWIYKDKEIQISRPKVKEEK